MSGENSGICPTTTSWLGSSPRERGKQGGSHGVFTPARIIPARARKTTLNSVLPDDTGDHPRSRGENCLLFCGFHPHPGSSPRERGKPRCHENRTLCLRFIPARAGKTCRMILQPGIKRAHPRVSGENTYSPVYRSKSAGSSPRERGKRAPKVPTPGGSGLIPA